MKNTLNDLRNHLFETLERVKDEPESIDLDRARCVADLGRTIVSAAKLQLQFYDLVGERGSRTTPGTATSFGKQGAAPYRSVQRRNHRVRPLEVARLQHCLQWPIGHKTLSKLNKIAGVISSRPEDKRFRQTPDGRVRDLLGWIL